VRTADLPPPPALDARIASYQADVTWLNNVNFEEWYAHVLRQPLNLPGTALP
jgi:hypothetical protein